MVTKFVLVSTLICLVTSVTSCGFYERGVSQREKDYIVYVHNYYRTLASQGKIPGYPKATNMLKMRWDSRLAAEAQKIAETCEFDHVAVRDGRFQVGQNLYTWRSSAFKKGFSWLSAIKAWFDEYPETPFGGSVYNHYTQVVWASTYLVGCGSSHFKRSDGWYQKLYVCNYGPAGNIRGYQPYAVSSSGKSKPKHSSKNYYYK